MAEHGGGTDILVQLRSAVKRRNRLRDNLSNVDEQIAQLIQAGFEAGISGSLLADTAEVSKPRVYQIRDGR